MSGPFETNPSRPTMFVTADYELFLGRRSGTIEACLIQPTDRLASLLESYGKKLILFVDILFYMRLRREADMHPELRKQVDRLRGHLQGLLARGHHLQLHLHPQWLDARYKEGEWHFPSGAPYALPSLSPDNDASSLKTIMGCVTQGKKCLEDLCREQIPSYSITCFRAGGLCVQPFPSIATALKQNGLQIDSSAAPGLWAADETRHYDFRNCPDKDSWRFDQDVCRENAQGWFLEMPVTTFQTTLFNKARTRWVRGWQGGKYSGKPWGDGQGLPPSRLPLRQRLGGSPALLTYDYWDARSFFATLRSATGGGRRLFTLLGHPKFLSPFGLEQLKKVLSMAKAESWA